MSSPETEAPNKNEGAVEVNLTSYDVKMTIDHEALRSLLETMNRDATAAIIRAEVVGKVMDANVVAASGEVLGGKLAEVVGQAEAAEADYTASDDGDEETSS